MATERADSFPPALFTEEGVRVYPVEAIARRVGLSRKRIFDLIRDGRVRGIKPATDWFVSIDDMEKYVSKPRRVGRPPGIQPRIELKPENTLVEKLWNELGQEGRSKVLVILTEPERAALDKLLPAHLESEIISDSLAFERGTIQSES